MSYVFENHSLISRVLENQIRKLHSAVGNAVTQGRLIVFGAGSTQLLNAAVACPFNRQFISPSYKVVASFPFYPVYQLQTDFFRSKDFQFQGDASVWKNNSDSTSNLIEFMTAPNNPDGQLNKAVLHGPYVKAIHDHAYYWPQFTAIPAPAE
ncbi:unnamed protein product, partial [Vitis vinifera]|uniref:Alliinase C-terminal domain-containing protein n=1 Tax=Vitis vinifera TaxID=29760 RepID=D7SXY4_VITVI